MGRDQMKPNYRWRPDSRYAGWTDLLYKYPDRHGWQVIATYRLSYTKKLWKVMFGGISLPDDAKYSVHEYNEEELRIMLYQQCLLLGLAPPPTEGVCT